MAWEYPLGDRLLKQQCNLLPFISILCLTKHLFHIYQTIQRYFLFHIIIRIPRKNNLLLICVVYGTVNKKLPTFSGYFVSFGAVFACISFTAALPSNHHDRCIYRVALQMTYFSSFVSVSGFFKGSYWSEDNRADTFCQHYPVYASAIPWNALKFQNILLLGKKFTLKSSRFFLVSGFEYIWNQEEREHTFKLILLFSHTTKGIKGI